MRRQRIKNDPKKCEEFLRRRREAQRRYSEKLRRMSAQMSLKNISDTWEGAPSWFPNMPQDNAPS